VQLAIGAVTINPIKTSRPCC